MPHRHGNIREQSSQQDNLQTKLLVQNTTKGEQKQHHGFLLFKEKNGEMLQKKLRNMINNLAGAGLVASQTSNDDLRMIIDNFLNGGKKYESGGVMPI